MENLLKFDEVNIFQLLTCEVILYVFMNMYVCGHITNHSDILSLTRIIMHLLFYNAPLSRLS